MIYIDHLTEEQLRLYAITDNQTATLGTWDDNLLRLELGELINLDLKLGLNLNFDATGFSTAEIDNLLMGAAPFDGEGAPAVQAVAITMLGDLWRLGDQLILCGNSLEEASYLRLLGDERAQLVIADNPTTCRPRLSEVWASTNTLISPLPAAR